MLVVRAQRAVNNVTMSSYESMPGCMLCTSAGSNTECVAELVQSGKKVHSTPQSTTQKRQEFISISREVKGVSPEPETSPSYHRFFSGWAVRAGSLRG
jgi:hypothetical protein